MLYLHHTGYLFHQILETRGSHPKISHFDYLHFLKNNFRAKNNKRKKNETTKCLLFSYLFEGKQFMTISWDFLNRKQCNNSKCGWTFFHSSTYSKGSGGSGSLSSSIFGPKAANTKLDQIRLVKIKKWKSTGNGLDEFLGGVGLRLAHHDDAADAELLHRQVVAPLRHLQHLQLKQKTTN